MTAFVPDMEAPIGNVAAEIAVISAMMCAPNLIDQIADVLSPEDFADVFVGHVYSLITREHSLGRPANPVTLKPYLIGEPAFDELGGMAWLASLTETSVAVGTAKGSARQIVELAQRRRLIQGLKAAIEAACDYNQPIEGLIEVADQAITEARDAGETRGEYSGVDCLDMIINSFDEPVTGVECRVIPSIDKLLGPMRPAHFIVGAGRPGMGKTATAISYALGAANGGYGVLFVSLEMSARELAERMAGDMCLDARVPYSAIRDRTLTNEQKREVCRAREHMADLPLQIIDRVMTVSQLRASVRRWKRRFEAKGNTLDLVIVDYIQRLKPDGKANRYETVTEISAAMKDIAKENSLAVFGLAQLNRAVEQRDDKRPYMSDLKESGQLEQDADAILFFLRDEYYLRQAGEPDPSDPKHEAWHRSLQACQGRIEFICAKRRNGETGSMMGDFLYTYQAVRG